MFEYLFYFLVTYGTHPLVIAALAATAMALKYADKHYEKIAPRLYVLFIYLSIFAWPLMEEIVRRYLVRWGIWLLLVVEIVSWIVRRRAKSKSLEKIDER